mgnify:CR=1 FL=1
MGLHGKDKHPRDIRRREKKVSQNKKKKLKESYKGDKKDNYKKRKIENVECDICYEKCENSSDNTIVCGKSLHFICADCKFRCIQENHNKCPLCRSHPLPRPTARDYLLPIYKNFKKPISIYQDDPSRMSMKQRRNEHRKTYYLAPFHCNTNRIVSQRKRWTYRTVDHNLTLEGWISESRALHYNGVDYNEIIYEDDASSTASTLTLVDWQDDEVDSQADDLSEYMDMVISSHE